jgi:hypothetical protein
MRFARSLPAVLLVSVLTGPACSGDPSDPPVVGTVDVDSLLAGLSMEPAAARITADDIADHVAVLAHDSMRGRLTGRPEIEDAAAYIAGVLEAAGLDPAGREGYLDRWTFEAGPDADSLAGLPPNVVALLPGSDPALDGTYVVVTAHFDHVGVGPPDATGDSIYNGADDNASGTAALLEVADALASMPEPPRRSVLFLAVSGEELGLLGALAYVQSPTVPRGGMVANINLDMVSRGPADTAYAIGHDHSELGPLAVAVADQVEAVALTLVPDPFTGQNLLFRSDHFAFALVEVPAIGLFGGFHPDYHTPADNPGTINAAKAADVARLAAHLVAAVAEMEEAPLWTELGEASLAPYW